MEYLLLNGQATVIIDGVDELGDSAYRQSFAELVDSFANRYPLTRIVVTSRIIGYSDAPLDHDLFPTIDIAPFDESQVSEYANRWFRLDATLNAHQRSQMTEGFMSESRVASDLRANPLVLSLLCGLYSSVRYIPRNKPEIYEKCAELLFETWDRSRGIEITHRYGAHIRPAVQRLAWRLFTDPQGRQALPRRQLIAFLTEQLYTRRFADPDEAEQAATDFLDFCAGRAWVLTDMGSDALQPHYGFVHRTFLEFFAASQLVKRKPDPDAVWAELEPHLGDSSWEVVGQLAVQILDRHYDDGGDLLLRRLLGHVHRQPLTSAAHLAFAARCLENIAPENSTLQGIVAPVVALACAVPATERRGLSAFEDYPSKLSETDPPLTVLFHITAPENTDRVAAALVESLDRYGGVMSEDTSIGIVHESASVGRYSQIGQWNVAQGNPSPVGPNVTVRLSQRAIPESAQLWYRMLDRPTADDVAKYGLRILYEWTRIDNYARGPVVSRIARTTVSRMSDDAYFPETWHETLEQYFPHVISQRRWLGQLSLPKSSWDTVLNRFDERVLLEMTSTSRAALVLLLLPVMKVTAPSVGAERVEQFMSAVRNDYRQAAGEVVNSWQLPRQTHEFLIEWITERSKV